jgi:isopentenyldiphosphate isomerase
MINFNCNVSIIIKKKDKILLAQRSYDDTIFPGYWCVPGGNYSIEDTCIEDIGIRECREEIGINISKEKLVLMQNNIKIINNSTSKLYVTYLTEINTFSEAQINNNEIIQIKLMTKEEIKNTENIIPHTKTLLLNLFEKIENNLTHIKL